MTPEEKLDQRKQDYEKLKLIHACVNCRKIDEQTKSGKVLCKKCSEKVATYQRNRRAKRKNAGACSACGGVLTDDEKAQGYVTCTTCRRIASVYYKANSRIFTEEQRAAQSAYKKELYAKRIAAGQCTLCGAQDNRTLEGKSYCEKCAQKRKESSIRRKGPEK